MKGELDKEYKDEKKKKRNSVSVLRLRVKNKLVTKYIKPSDQG